MDANKHKLIVALDLPSYDAARDLVNQLGGTVSFYKIGLELLFSDGLSLARELKLEGKSVFLDLKFLDIANTVERAVAAASDIGVDLMTIHGHDTKTVAAAVRGRGKSQTKLLAVTVLTSLDASDLEEQGIGVPAADLVLKRAALAAKAGIDGIVASGQEAAAVRAQLPKPFLIVTPGIRLPEGEAGDQSRVTTPEQAIRAGADHLVVGRPINAAKDPKRAAEMFLEHIAAA